MVLGDTLADALEAWAGLAVFSEVRYHMIIVPKEIGTRRKVWIVREVSWQVVATRVHKYGDLRWLWATRSPTRLKRGGAQPCFPRSGSI